MPEVQMLKEVIPLRQQQEHGDTAEKGIERQAQRITLDAQWRREKEKTRHHHEIPEQADHQGDQELPFGLRQSSHETGHDVEEPHGNEKPGDLDRQVVLRAFERWRKEMDKLRSEDEHEDRHDSEEHTPDESHLVDQLPGPLGVVLAVVDIPWHDQGTEPCGHDTQEDHGHHHADQERVGLSSSPPVVGNDRITRKPRELAEKGHQAQEHRRLGNRLAAQQALRKRLLHSCPFLRSFHGHSSTSTTLSITLALYHRKQGCLVYELSREHGCASIRVSRWNVVRLYPERGAT